MRSVFLDTAFAIALVSQQDMYHERAGTLLEEIERKRTSVVTTQAIRERGYVKFRSVRVLVGRHGRRD